MRPDQILIGGLIAALCASGLWEQRLLLAETKKGRWLVERLGPERALWVLRIALVLGLAFGVLLATGIVNPVRWPADAEHPRDSGER